jgi:hypothetical protein
MHNHTALVITAALIAVSIPSQVSAQRGRGGGGGGGRGGAGRLAGAPAAMRPAIPREPAARDGAHAAPMFEPSHPAATVPYVRNDQWYGHAAVDDPRLRLASPFQNGRFALTGPSHVYALNRVDIGARRIWLPGGQFEIADYDWDVTAPWCWTCDQFVVYADPDHAGWYLVYDVRMGEYVHAQFLGQ